MKTVVVRIRVMKQLLLSLILLMALGIGCDRAAPPQDSQQSSGQGNTSQAVTLGIQNSTAMALVMVAKDEGIFKKHGLDVDIKLFAAGKDALTAMIGGSLDFTVSGEVPICLASLQGQKLTVIAQVVESTKNEVRMVALKDDDLTTPESYFAAKTRKVATSIGGGPEFFVYDFFKRHHINSDQVEIIAQRAPDMPATLESHSIDAFAVFDPYVFIAEQRLHGQVITFPYESGQYSEFYVLSAMQSAVDKNPATAKEMVAALVDASTLAAANPQRAKEIVAQYTKLQPDVVNSIWHDFVFEPALTDDLIKTWNREGVWAVETKKVPQDTAQPDFASIVNRTFLDEALQLADKAASDHKQH